MRDIFKDLDFFDKLFGSFLENVLGSFLEDFLEEFFVYIGIDLFVKILVFVKICLKAEEGRKKEKIQHLEVRVQAHRT